MKKIIMRAAALLLALTACAGAVAADKQYAYTLDYSALPSDIFKRQITINVSVGTASSCNVTADGAAVACSYTASTGTCSFSLTNTASSVVVTAVNWTTGGTGAATKATLFNNKKWAYSFTFDDGYATDYTVDLPMFSALNLRAGMAIVTSWIGGGNYMSRTQLTALFNAGWSVFNHSTSHPQNTISCSNLATYVGAAKTTLESWFPANYKNIYYVYPYLETGYETCLSTAGYVHAAEGVDGLNYADNFTSTNFFGLYRHGMYASVTAAQANAWADAAASNSRPAWMITFTHMTYSGSSTPGTYDTNEATLSSHINYVYNTYGAGGTTNNMWFAPSDEVLMYLYTRQYLVINTVTAPTPTATQIAPTVTITRIISTATFTATSTYTRTNTPTLTTTYTNTASLTDTSSTTATPTQTYTRSFTATATKTCTPVAPTSTSSVVPSTTSSVVPSPTDTSTVPEEPTGTNTQTNTPVPATPTFTVTSTQILPADTLTSTNTALIPTATSTAMIPSATSTSSVVPSATSTSSVVPSATSTSSVVPSATSTGSAVSSATSTEIITNTATQAGTPSVTDTRTPAATVTSSPVNTITHAPSATDTFTPTLTYTQTPVNTATEVPTEIPLSPTFTATPAETGGIFKITVDEIYPNPYNPALYDLVLNVGGNRNVSSYSLKIFTEAFRLIREINVDKNMAAGKNAAMINRANFNGISGGIYYYVLSAASVDGLKAVSKPGTVIILNK